MTILGIDPGFDRVGWAILDHFELVACGLIQTDREAVIPVRLFEVHSRLSEIIKQYMPTDMSIESLFFFKNAKTVINVSQARGVALLTAHMNKLRIHEFTPLQVKSIVTGNGHADKKAVEKMVRLQIRNVPEKLQDDTIDAIAIAAAVHPGPSTLN